MIRATFLCICSVCKGFKIMYSSFKKNNITLKCKACHRPSSLIYLYTIGAFKMQLWFILLKWCKCAICAHFYTSSIIFVKCACACAMCMCMLCVAVWKIWMRQSVKLARHILPNPFTIYKAKWNIAKIIYFIQCFCVGHICIRINEHKSVSFCAVQKDHWNGSDIAFAIRHAMRNAFRYG